MSGFLNSFNKAIDDLLVHDKVTNTLHGRVCLVCDKFLTDNDYSTMLLTTFLKCTPYLKGDPGLNASLRASYQFTNVLNDRKATDKLSQCLLSPRSKLIYKNGNIKSKPHIMCCKTCKSGLRKRDLEAGKLPRFAIANNLAIGIAPECIEKLNDVELSLVSQARFRGHLFTYWGGCHKSIKGWHSFYDINPLHVAGVLQQVSTLTENDNIAVVLSGPFTTEQRNKVLQKTKVNIPNVVAALEWLRKNNTLYADVPIPLFGQPTIIDNSSVVDGEISDIELKEEIKVVFPDGAINTGGCQDKETFERALEDLRAKSSSTPPYVTSRPSQQIVQDFKDMTLMKAFPKQFPFGLGFQPEFTLQASLLDFLTHFEYLSIPAFHEAAFGLVLHNMFEKCKALTGALWQVTGNEKCDVTEEELNAAISR